MKGLHVTVIGIAFLQIRNMRSACALREAAITAKLKEHLNILEEREDLDGQLKQIQSELVLAHEAIIEQVKSVTLLSLQCILDKKPSL